MVADANKLSRASSAASSVLQWLEGLPSEPHAYLSTGALRHTKRKRKREQGLYQDSPPPQRKSRRLAAISGNAVMQRALRKVTSTEHKLHTTPARSTRGKKNLTQHNEHIDASQVTPRATQPPVVYGSLDGIADIPRRSTADLLSDPSSEASSSRCGDSTTFSKTGRSRSPTKSLGDTQFCNIPIHVVPWEANIIPQVVRPLVQELKLLSKGIHVVPLQVQDRMKAAGEEVELHELSKEQDGEGEAWPHSLSHEELWVRIHEVWQAAMECYAENAPEATWNAEVHSRLLRLALRGELKAKGVWYEDVTTASISDKSLLPYFKAIPLQSKLVDYAIILDPDSTLKDRIVARLSATQSSTKATSGINAAAAEWIRFRPVAVSIETKRESNHDDTAVLQLGMWTISHFLNLQRLLGDRKALEDLPVLPILSIAGHSWRLMLASIAAGQKLELIGYTVLGDTVSLVGIYKIIASLRSLGRWVNEVYRPWFEDSILADVEQLSQ
ncbi:MAG: hypothetical protein Q9217_006311 [Psora testacea]